MTDRQFFAHPNALVDTEEIGAGTRVWAFAHVMTGARVGANCNIGEQCFIESGAVVGDDVVIKNGVALWDGVTLEDRVFVGPNAVFTNDVVPRSKLFRKAVPTLVREGASIGANATVRCGIEVGRSALVGAGAVVTRNVPDFALVVGNPARAKGFVCQCGERLKFDDRAIAHCECGLRFRNEGGVVGMFGNTELIDCRVVQESGRTL